jgi:hypothetical protein
MESSGGRKVEPPRQNPTGLVWLARHRSNQRQANARGAMHDPIQSKPKDSEVRGQRHDWAAAGRWLATRMLGVAKAKDGLGAQGSERKLEETK